MPLSNLIRDTTLGSAGPALRPCGSCRGAGRGAWQYSRTAGNGGTKQAAEKRSEAVILSPFAVILSAAKNLALPLRANCAKNRALSIFKAMRDSSFAMPRTACGSSE